MGANKKGSQGQNRVHAEAESWPKRDIVSLVCAARDRPPKLELLRISFTGWVDFQIPIPCHGSAAKSGSSYGYAREPLFRQTKVL